MFLKVVAIKQWKVHHMDVHNAFLHGDLSEEVYIKLPLRFSWSDNINMCRLQKSLYGLK